MAFVVLGTILLLLGILILQLVTMGLQVGMVIQVVVIILFLWMWFGTGYRITDEYINYYCGPFRGKIAIAGIREVKRDTTLWIGYRPALARKGLIIKYNKYDDIYFSPDSNDAFIKALLIVNPGILVV